MDSHKVEMDTSEDPTNAPKSQFLLESFTDSPGLLIEDEKFDFDLLTTPKSTTEEDDDEIFFGEVGLKERCISKVVEEEAKAGPLTPLSNEDWAKICVEAHKMSSILHMATMSPAKRPKKEPEVALNTTFEIGDCQDSPITLDLNFDIDEAFDLKVPKDMILPVDMPKVQVGVKRKAGTPKSGLTRRSLPMAKSSLADPPSVSSVRKMAVHSPRNTGARRSLVAPSKVKSSADTSQLASRFQRSASFADRSKTQKATRSSTLQRPVPIHSRLAKPGSVATSIAAAAQPRVIQPPKPTVTKPTAQSGLKKPQIKSAMTSLNLMKPGSFQRGGLVRQTLRKPTIGGQVNGPLRATANASQVETPCMIPASSKLESIKVSPSTPKARREGLTATKRRLTTEIPLTLTPKAPTPLIDDSKLNSTFTLPCTPTGPTKRRSFLPTPGKRTSSSSSMNSRESVSSLSSLDSPSMNTRGRSSPVIGRPPCQPPRVQHTPLLKENALPPKMPSRWSPLPKPKVIDSTDRYNMCTKKLSKKF